MERSEGRHREWRVLPCLQGIFDENEVTRLPLPTEQAVCIVSVGSPVACFAGEDNTALWWWHGRYKIDPIGETLIAPNMRQSNTSFCMRHSRMCYCYTWRRLRRGHVGATTSHAVRREVRERRMQ